MCVAKVPRTALAELCSPLSASSLALHLFLAADAEAPNVTNLNLFAELEIGTRIGVKRRRRLSSPCPRSSPGLGFGPGLRFCFRFLRFALAFHGWVARTSIRANDSQCLTKTMGIR